MNVKAGEGVRVVWLIRDDSANEYRNVFSYFNDNTSDVDLSGAAVETWAANLWDQVDDLISTKFELYGCVVEGVETFGTMTKLFATPYTGVSSGDPLPRQLAALVTGYTGERRGIAHKYICGLTELSVTDGLWVSGVTDMLDDFGATWIEPFDTGFFSFTAATYNPLRTPKWAPIESTIGRQIPSTQRRRKVGVGS